MANKMTKRDYFNALRTLATSSNRSDLIDFIDHELELLDRKKASPKADTERQKQNADIKIQILNTMESGKAYTATDIQKLVGIESNQRATALIRQLKDEGLVIRSVEKGKALFSKA